MEPVLTQEELEAIYAAMKGDELPSAFVDDVALTAGQEYISRAETKWNEAIKGMSSRVESILMGALGRRVTVRLYPSEAWLSDGEDNMGGSNTFPLQDGVSVLSVGKIGETYAIFAMDLELARKAVERKTGAIPTAEGANEAAQRLTPLETRLLKDLISDLVNTTAKATPSKVAGTVASIDPEDVWSSRKPDEIWVIGSLGIAELEGRGIRFMAPSSLFLPKLKNARDLLADHLKQATVTIAVELGKFKMNVAKLWQLRPGTVIPLSTTVGDPLKISVGGVTKLLGKPGVSRGNVSVELTGHIENGVKK